MDELEDWEKPFDLPEETKDEIINKISALALAIRMDWNYPKAEAQDIIRLCDKLKTIK